MLRKKCSGCGQFVEKKFNFCPYCGMSFKMQKEKENYGMIGRDDIDDIRKQFQQEIRLPFGLDKMVNHMIKQLNRELSNLDSTNSHGFKIQISTGKPVNRVMHEMDSDKQRKSQISLEEIERRKELPREEAESNIRRLPDRIVYEIVVPGVKSNNDIVITKLENSMEIKAYSKDKCFYKIIPLKVEVMRYYIKNNRLFLELRN